MAIMRSMIQKSTVLDSFDHAWQTDSCRYFVGGVINQRAALIIRSGTVVGGFGSVCDFYNYTGMLVGVNKVSGAVTQVYATDGGPGATPETNNLQGNGGKAGVWMGGMGFSSDGQGRIYFVTGKKESSLALLCKRNIYPRARGLHFGQTYRQGDPKSWITGFAHLRYVCRGPLTEPGVLRSYHQALQSAIQVSLVSV